MATERPTFQAVLKWDEEQCRDFLASMRWPNGVHCPKCSSMEEPYTIQRRSSSKNLVRSLYKCRACRRQFSATVGTIFEDSHIPLNKWLAALFPDDIQQERHFRPPAIPPIGPGLLPYWLVHGTQN